MHPSDWMSQAFERFQSATRNVRLTLPPCRDSEFWIRMVELARIKQRGLTITVLIDSNPQKKNNVLQAVQSLNNLELNGHEVSWVAADTLPFSLFIVDDTWALLTVANPRNLDEVVYARLTEDLEETSNLRRLFDSQTSGGIWGIDPESWLDWLEHVPHKKVTRTALAAINRGQDKLAKAVKKSLKSLPKRSCWLVKPNESAYGISESESGKYGGSSKGNHWFSWVEQEVLSLGWPLICDSLNLPNMPSKTAFKREFKRHYPDQKSLDRAFATIRHFLKDVIKGDRVAAMEGWTSTQSIPVKFFGWARIEGDAVRNDFSGDWPVGRKSKWYRFEVDLPVQAVRAATKLKSATYPIHSLDTFAFRRLVALAEEIRHNQYDSQLLLDLALLNGGSGKEVTA